MARWLINGAAALGVVILFAAYAFAAWFVSSHDIATLVPAANAHEAPSGMVYPPECCGGSDCRPVPCDELSDAADGGVTWRDKLFERPRVRLSQDVQCHVCVNGPANLPICVFTHQGV